MIPEIQKALQDKLLAKTLGPQHVQVIQESHVRHLGLIHDQIEYRAKEVRNPVKWFTKGMKSIIAAPATALMWVGLITETTLRRWKRGALLKLIAGVSAILSLIGAVMTIILGWDQFHVELLKLMPHG